MNRRTIAIILGTVLAILVVIGTVGVVAVDDAPAEALPEANLALESGDGVTVTQDPWITFTPDEPVAATGFIFYPGGLVDPVAYAPAVRQVAEAAISR
jgi:hypothetical protein